jgi:hypothetical protein
MTMRSIGSLGGCPFSFDMASRPLSADDDGDAVELRDATAVSHARCEAPRPWIDGEDHGELHPLIGDDRGIGVEAALLYLLRLPLALCHRTKLAGCERGHRNRPRVRCRPSCQETPMPRTRPVTSRPRNRSRMARQGTSVSGRSLAITANRPPVSATAPR